MISSRSCRVMQGESEKNMKSSDFDKMKSFIYSHRFKGTYRLSDGSEIRSRKVQYGTEYALYTADNNCVTVEYDIERFRFLLV